MIGGRWDKLARGIKSFVKNPVTNLVKGMVLVLIGLSEVSRTFRDDLAHGHVSLGYGMILIGLFSILDVLPNLIDGLEAWVRYLELREKRDRAEEERSP